MKVFLISLMKLALKIIYAPLKLAKTKNRIVYLSRQSNAKSMDMLLLEKAVAAECPDIEQVFRLRMLEGGMADKIKYGLALVGDMYYLATSKVAVLDTYSITVSCLKHKKDLKVIQIWHALGAVKKFGLQSLGTKEGRDEKVSRAMCMHQNYDYVLSPSAETAKFYMEAFGVESGKIKLCPLPRVDYLPAGTNTASDYFYQNPAAGHKTTVLYLPTFRERDGYIIQKLKTAFEDRDEFNLLICPHPLSTAQCEERYVPSKEYSTEDLIKIADVVITDYSACAFEAALLMKKLYFFTPDYNEYTLERGLNIDLKAELPTAVFDDADALVSALQSGEYDMDSLFAFKEKYIVNSKNNTETLAKFVAMLVKE